MSELAYRLCATTDPEERLEDAALWKAMRDEFGDAIDVIAETEKPAEGTTVFGRSRMYELRNANPVPPNLRYWTDPEFLARAARRFEAVPWDHTLAAIAALHADGRGAFVKSTQEKHAIFRIPVGADSKDEIGDMVFSFIDGGPELMVQELCTVEFEHRFFCIDREIVTHSPVQWELTPIDRPRPGTVYRTPRERESSYRPDVFRALYDLATGMAANMATPHAAIDCGLFDGRPGVIELNPMRLGECGLYACNVRALAKAARKLVALQ